MMNAPFWAGCAFTLLGLYMLRFSVLNFRKALASEGWPTVRGELLEVTLWGRRNVKGEAKEVERLRLKYQYEVDGRSHSGTAVSYFTLVYPETVEFAEAHPEGSEVQVHYDPANPADSVLIPGPRRDKRHSDLILASLGVLVGLVLAVLGWLEILG